VKLLKSAALIHPSVVDQVAEGFGFHVLGGLPDVSPNQPGIVSCPNQ
jgi:hypothetical protein